MGRLVARLTRVGFDDDRVRHVLVFEVNLLVALRPVVAHADHVEAVLFIFRVETINDRRFQLPVVAPRREIDDEHEFLSLRPRAQIYRLARPHPLERPVFVIDLLLLNRRILVLVARGDNGDGDSGKREGEDQDEAENFSHGTSTPNCYVTRGDFLKYYRTQLLWFLYGAQPSKRYRLFALKPSIRFLSGLAFFSNHPIGSSAALSGLTQTIFLSATTLTAAVSNKALTISSREMTF